jgi:hypothetical protein
MTQVHYTYANPCTWLSKKDGYWFTSAGDEVFSIHGRIGDKDWFDEQMRGAKKFFVDNHIPFTQEMEERVRATLRAIQKEWYDINCNHKLNVYDYCPYNKYWETFK